MKNFEVPETINFFSVDYDSGKNVGFNDPKAIVEAFKEKSIDEIKLNKLNFEKKHDKFNQFTRFY